MKKYGKFERMPDGTRAKQPAAKTMLLQTYLTSLLCMVLCVAMFFGTTFAWFTDEVINEGNEIYIGILKVELEKQVPDGADEDTEPDYVSLSEKKSDGTNVHKLFNDGINWEPGYTVLETVKITNRGDLAFRYEMTFAKNSTVDETAAKWFDVWCYHDAQNTVPAPENYAQITEANGWKKIGSLAEVLAGKTVFRGDMTKEAIEAEEAYVYTIALHMNGEEITDGQQTELNGLMGKTIDLNAKLVATQMSSEQDAFGDTYDSGKEITARVTKLGAMNIEASPWLGQAAQPMTLDAAYQFQPLDSYEEVQNSPYKDYVADFVVYADKVVQPNTVALAGFYNLFCQYNDNNWIAMQYDGVVQPGEELRLVAGLYYPLTYELLCQFGNDGTGFLCGIANLDEGNVGTTVTVELRLYERDAEGNETGEYVVANTVKHTFQAKN